MPLSNAARFQSTHCIYMDFRDNLVGSPPITSQYGAATGGRYNW